MKYPNNRESCVKYAEYLTNLHGENFLPIERKEKLNNKFAINFAAAKHGEELTDFLCNGWAIIQLTDHNQ